MNPPRPPAPALTSHYTPTSPISGRLVLQVAQNSQRDVSNPCDTDHALVSGLFSYSKGAWPRPEGICDPAALDTAPASVILDDNTVRLNTGIDAVTPTDRYHGRGPAIR